jgi:hypothetical protein
MHPDLETLQRFRHRELGAAEHDATREHLAGCAECRACVELAERDEQGVMTLLAEIDAPMPAVSFGDVAARAARRTYARTWRIAAMGLLMLAVGGVAWAIPGSPLRALTSVVFSIANEAERSTTPSTPPERTTPAPPVAGIAVPADGPLVITFVNPSPSGSVLVTLVDDDHIAVRAPVGTVRFESGVGRLNVRNDVTLGTLEIDLPRSARDVEIRVRDRSIFHKRGSKISAAWSATTDGRYRLPLR